jgi:hypothetical protein
MQPDARRLADTARRWMRPRARPGAVLLAGVLTLAVTGWWNAPDPATAAADAGASAPVAPGATTPRLRPSARLRPAPQATFGEETPSADVRHVANWVLHSGDAQGRSFILVDKKEARVWVFDGIGRHVADSPALLGAARGDDAVPGIGEKPLSQVLPEEKTTPAGRYVAEPGVNANGEDIVWVSYDLAVSLHRVRPNVAAERRLERLESADPQDNRISFGCINLPVTFYEQVLSPVAQAGAVVYVLPETRTPQEQFGSYDVAPAHLAATAVHSSVK